MRSWVQALVPAPPLQLPLQPPACASERIALMRLFFYPFGIIVALLQCLKPVLGMHVQLLVEPS
ncbi:hypothetical protein EJ02DRAFT_484827 [Clathrospora elynae]|uniref:Uncharacterized protein n=1 Tax=Clathrospora elynae TaxID=706981 RepID=A0A6A5SV47_9PLEO|nr:hypothetical protein EJ02DRAFT_484827 [Clathrospora elynae]